MTTRGPEWKGWESLFLPGKPIEWRKNEYGIDEAWIADHCVAYMNKRPAYCDRGHVQVYCELPGLDWADGFPRYYMSREVAISETEAFLKWRLWRQA